MRLQHDDLTAGRKARSTDDLEAVEKELESQPAPQPDGPAAPEKRYGSDGMTLFVMLVSILVLFAVALVCVYVFPELIAWFESMFGGGS